MGNGGGTKRTIFLLAALGTAAIGWRAWACDGPIERRDAAPTAPPAPSAEVAASRPAFASVERRAFVDDGLGESEADSRPASRPESRPESRAEPEPNIRGRIVSPRVKRPNAGSDAEAFGVVEGRCALTAMRLREASRRLTVYEIAEYRTTADPDGAFALRLPPGAWRISAEHRVDAEAPVEAWYAVIDVPAEGVVDLGDNAFSQAVTRGRVVDAGGAAMPKAVVQFCDITPGPASAKHAGVGGDVTLAVDAAGRFAFTWAAYAGPRSLRPQAFVAGGELTAFVGPHSASVDDVALGSDTLIVVTIPPPSPDDPVPSTLLLEVPAGARAWIRRGAQLLAWTVPVTSPRADGLHEMRFTAPRGEFVMELVDGPRWAEVTWTVADDVETVLRPTWVEGRVVEGTARGRVARVVAGPPKGRDEAQSVVADGEFRLEGLPPAGELTLRVGDRVVVVPANSGPVHRIPD